MYDSVRREVLYNILIEFGISRKLVRINVICLSESCSEVHIGEPLCDAFLVQNSLKQGDALSSLLLKFAIELVISKDQENQEGLELNRAQFMVCAVDDNLMGKKRKYRNSGYQLR
jgi:hypothetical protein